MNLEKTFTWTAHAALAIAVSGCAGNGTANNAGAGGAASGGNTGAGGATGATSGGGSAGVDGGASGSAGSTAGQASSGNATDGSTTGSSPTAVMCGSSVCDVPKSCCQAAGAAPVCVVSCNPGETQLCAADLDCQAAGGATCVNGSCTEGVTDAGVADVAPLEGGVTMPGTGGVIPPGYPQPTAANRALCQTTSMMVGGRCLGGGAGPVCIECLFGGSTYNSAQTPTPDGISKAGNYVVTVQLGGNSAGQTFISAESSRGLLAPVGTAVGASVEYAFVVNAREMEGQPNHAGGPGGYPGLDLFFSGPTATPPEVTAIGYALAGAGTKPIMVYIASDSTACDQTGNVFAGWGQMLPQYFGPPVGIANYANSGAGSGSFPYWSNIKARWTAGDWVLIQFGHNDGALSDATVQANLERFVSDALAANVTPILVSPPARVQFVGNVESNQSSLHAAAAKAAAAAKNVAYVDLTTLSIAWYNSLGSSAAAMKFHANGTDHTHTNLAGADKLAGLLAGAMKAQNIPLAQYLR